jgi:hypothetical protein
MTVRRLSVAQERREGNYQPVRGGSVADRTGAEPSDAGERPSGYAIRAAHFRTAAAAKPWAISSLMSLLPASTNGACPGGSSVVTFAG